MQLAGVSSEHTLTGAPTTSNPIASNQIGAPISAIANKDLITVNVPCENLKTEGTYPADTSTDAQYVVLPSRIRLIGDSQNRPVRFLLGTCSVDRPIQIENSHISLDCQNSTIAAKGVGILAIPNSVGNDSFWGIRCASTPPNDTTPPPVGQLRFNSSTGPMNDIEIKNCTIAPTGTLGSDGQDNSRTGIYLGWKGDSYAGSDAAQKANGFACSSGWTYQQVSDNSVTQVTVSHVRMSGLGSGGIFLGSHSRYVLIDNVNLDSLNGDGVYLDTSHDVIVQNSRFVHLGGVTKREALSIDSSFNNTIRNNVFQDNQFGSIDIYKNCGEKGFLREWSAIGNVIQNNNFSFTPANLTEWQGGLASSAAVHVGSRTSKLLGDSGGCGTTPLVRFTDQSGNHLSIYPDVSQSNTVIGNTIVNHPYGVQLEDDFNQVNGNTFSETSDFPLTKAVNVIVARTFTSLVAAVEAHSTSTTLVSIDSESVNFDPNQAVRCSQIENNVLSSADNGITSNVQIYRNSPETSFLNNTAQNSKSVVTLPGNLLTQFNFSNCGLSIQ